MTMNAIRMTTRKGTLVLKKLMIVESPHKAKVIGGFLGSNYTVIATKGYIFELKDTKSIPASKQKDYGAYSINVNDGSYDTLKQVIRGSKGTLDDLKAKINSGQYDTFYVSTDPDRAGEQIGAEVVDYLAKDLKKNNVKVLRATWHEITKKAVEDGLKNPTTLDDNMVKAAEARQIYDRLFGYSVSPYLWRTVGSGTSGGRAQSPALRLVVDREKARIAFTKAEYYSIKAVFTKGGNELEAELTNYNGRKIATGSDFDSKGKLKNDKVLVINDDNYKSILADLKKKAYSIGDITESPYTRNPGPPLKTSTMQQFIGNRLGMSTKKITSIAQSLYETYSAITYIRSDAVFLAPEAIAEARRIAVQKYGKSAVPAKPNFYGSGKNVQGGHEAIRPTINDSGHFTFPSKMTKITRLDPKAMPFYDLIFKRTVASQMTPAKGTTKHITIDSKDGKATFKASDTVITDKGFMRIYEDDF